MFRRKPSRTNPVVIHGKKVDVVDQYKYLSTILKFEQNIKVIIKKAHRQYFHRILNSFSVQKPILQTFYSFFIESILCFSFICWFPSLTVKNRNHLLDKVSTCSKITGAPLQRLISIYEQQVRAKAHDIMGDNTHVLKP